MNKSHRLLLSLIALSALALCNVTNAQNFPSKPIRIIVAFPPGGATDVVGRMLAGQMSQSMQQSVVVENKPGANGNIGADLVAKSKPDGYTLVLVPGTHVISRVLHSTVPFDPIADFEPVGTVVKLTYGIIANPRVSANNLRELIAYAKANPGKLTYGTAGQGTMNHLAMELVKQMAGVNIVTVNYKGIGPAVTDVMAGHIDLVVTSQMSIVRSGKVKGLAVIANSRIADMPDVPTAAESGLPGCTSDNWLGLLAPAGTPQPVVERLNAEIAKALRKLNEGQLAKVGTEPYAGSPQELASLMKQDQAKWTKLIREIGIKGE